MECMRAKTRPRFTLSSENVLGNGGRTHVAELMLTPRDKCPQLEGEKTILMTFKLIGP